MSPFENKEVEQLFDSYPTEKRKKLLTLRQLILDTSKELAPNEKITENLKWNQPTYTSREGTPIRIGLFEEENIAVFFHCQTNLIEQFREKFSDRLEFSKNRAIVLKPADDLPINELKMCIQMGLTYHRKP